MSTGDARSPRWWRSASSGEKHFAAHCFRHARQPQNSFWASYCHFALDISRLCQGEIWTLGRWHVTLTRALLSRRNSLGSTEKNFLSDAGSAEIGKYSDAPSLYQS